MDVQRCPLHLIEQEVGVQACARTVSLCFFSGLMSLGYAEKLSFRADLGGQLGDPELKEAAEAVAGKVQQLAAWVGSPHHSWMVE